MNLETEAVLSAIPSGRKSAMSASAIARRAGVDKYQAALVLNGNSLVLRRCDYPKDRVDKYYVLSEQELDLQRRRAEYWAEVSEHVGCEITATTSLGDLNVTQAAALGAAFRQLGPSPKV